MPLSTRIRLMLLGWGSVGLAYTTGRLLPGTPTHLDETAIDRLVTFNPAGVWLYLSFFLMVPLAFLTADANRVRYLTRSMQLCALVSGVIFVVWPTTLHYPAIPTDRASASLLRALAESDSSQNCFPSLHGALTLLCVTALCQRCRPGASLFAVLWGLGIGWSVIQTRRHIAIDLGAGVVLGIVSAWLIASSSHIRNRLFRIREHHASSGFEVSATEGTLDAKLEKES